MKKTPSLKKLAIIGTVGLPAKYGGFETLTENIVKHLQNDFEITVYCSAKFYPKSEQKKYFGKARLIYIPLQANGIQSIPYDMISIIHAAFKSDYLLVLGVSGCVLLPFVKFFTRKRTFVNIDGIEWKRDKWGKLIKAFLRYSEIFAVESAEAIITDNKVITDYLKESYDYDSHLIEYGGDQAFYVPVVSEDIKKYPFLSKRYGFSVCRIEPENNIHIILEGMSKTDRYPLVLVGNWNKSAYGKEIREQYKDLAHFYLLDPIYEPNELNLLRSNCYFYLHGHSAGGTNPSLVEAMNLKLAIFAFDVMYNRESTEGQAVYFKNANDLQMLVNYISEEARENLAEKMYQISQRRYTWKIIAQKYKKMIELKPRLKKYLIQ